jgi:peptide/nickel transport system ATP-binding protein
MTASDLHERAARGTEILRVDGLVKHFPIRGGLLNRQVGAVQPSTG